MKITGRLNIAYVMPSIAGHIFRGSGTYYLNLLKALKKDKRLNVREISLSEPAKEFDLIHYPYFDSFFITMPLLGTLGSTPHVVTVHDLIPHKYPDKFPVGLRGLFKWSLQKSSLQRAKAIITDSLASKKDIVKIAAIKEDKISVIPLAADSDFKKINNQNALVGVSAKFNLPDNFILHVGDLNYNKNIDGLIAAFSQFADVYNDFSLVLVGRGFIDPSPVLTEFSNVLKKYHLDNKIIRLAGLNKNELVSLYNLSRVYVQPSFDEGFGLPVLEAFACQTPVVSSNTGSLPEVAGNAALYINPHQVSEITLALKRILSDYSLRKDLIEKGNERVKKFTWEKTAQETINLYFRALGVKDYFFK